ncbi:MAG: hypothetical protein QOJ91_1226 [Sphingomonadales bacterium]|jgi:hypothetical protein|nr:hypothetical protein [Sphingomonadales bacterium]
MREPGFEDLANLWQDPEDGNRELFEALARRARRKGRLLGYADFVLFLLIVLGIVPSLFMAPNAVTVTVAILLLVATLWLNWTRRRLRHKAFALNTSETAAFLEGSVANAKANLRRVNLSLMLMPPMVVMALIFKVSQRSRGGIETLPQGILEWASVPRAWAGLTVVAVLLLLTFHSRRRLRAELAQLEKLRLDYEREKRRDLGIE